MSAGTRVAAFGALLVAIFALAIAGGSALDPATKAAEPGHHAAPAPADTTSADAHPGAPAAPGAAADGGLRLVTQSPTALTPGRRGRLTFRIADAEGATLRDFDTEQARRMHLIVVRRDLRRFQHLHPVQDATGAWTVGLTLPDAGVYHAFADFSTAGARRTLGTDLFAGGRFAPLPLPSPSHRAAADGYDVALRDDGDQLRFTVGRGGVPIAALQPYLGARGHLVMLRAGDLAYEHAHPLGDQLAFDVGDAAPGRYRLFLQFRHGGRVHTAALTHEVRP